MRSKKSVTKNQKWEAGNEENNEKCEIVRSDKLEVRSVDSEGAIKSEKRGGRQQKWEVSSEEWEVNCKEWKKCEECHSICSVEWQVSSEVSEVSS